MDGRPPDSLPPVVPRWDDRPAPPPGQVPWRAREGLVIALLGLVGSVMAALVAQRFIQDDDLLTAAIIVIFEVMLALFAIVWVRARHGAGLDAFGVRPLDRGDLGAGVLAGGAGLVLAQFIVGPIVLVIADAFSQDRVELPDQLQLDDPSGAVLALTGIAVVLIAPVAEELFFRGFLYRALRRWASVRTAAAISAAIFAVVHYAPLIIPSIFALGIVLALAVERRRSLMPAIVAHMVFNAVGYTVYLVTS